MSYYYLRFKHLISHYHVPNSVLGNGLDPIALSALILSGGCKQPDPLSLGEEALWG